MTPRIATNDDKLDSEYAPTFLAEWDDTAPFVNSEHAKILEVVRHVDGLLQAADAEKLYEMAFHARGPVLEIGCLHGKSTSILALAISAGGGGPLVSVDVNPAHIAIAKANVQKLAPGADVQFLRGKSGKLVPSLKQQFAFVFVDGNHRYEAVRRDLQAVDGKLRPAGFVLLHDYYDGRNFAPADEPRYGVVRAAKETLEGRDYAFRGRYGCTALYQKAPTAATPPKGLARLLRRRGSGSF